MTELHHHLLELREHLETFYSSLGLAPPYHSIEKALTTFGSEFKSKTAQDQQHIHLDEPLKQYMYLHAFIESGLCKKHRGIIAGLLKSSTPPTLGKEYQYLLALFMKED